MSTVERLERACDDVAIPEPLRSHVVLEIARDVADMRATLIAQGEPAALARLHAERLLLPSAAAARDLAHLHATPLGRLVLRIPAGALERRLALLLVSVPATLVLLVMLRLGVRGGAPLGLLVVAPLCLIAAATAARVVVRLHTSTGPRRGAARSYEPALRRMLLLAGLMLIAGVLGALFELQTMHIGPVADGLPLVIARIGRAAETMAVGLSGALLTMAAWYPLRGRTAAMRALRTEARALLLDDTEV